MRLDVAQTLGRYILERTIAIGGMGEVFHARQTGPDGFDRTCVVKTMHPNLAKEPEVVDLFLEEARLTARLTHPHIAQVYDFGKIDDAYYIAMELVDGPSLHTVVKTYATRAQKLPVATVLRIVSQAAQALDYVHRLKGPDGAPLNLVHRDISPGNLLLSREGLVKLIDFGIAKARTTQRQTAMGQIRGKLAYMSPEQMVGQPLDGRTDIYSLGLVLFELLSGRRANPGRNEVEILMSVKTQTLAPISTLRSDCPPSLAKVLERATARDRDQRYPRAGDFSQALERVLIELGAAVTPDDLAAVAEEVTLAPPLPAGDPTRPGVRPPPPGVPTQAEAPAAPPVQKPTVVGAPVVAPTGPATEPSTRSLNARLVIGGLVLAVFGGAVGALWSYSARQGAQPAAPVLVAPPPPVAQRPRPALVAPAVAPAVADPAPPAGTRQPPEPARQPAKSRWAKREKFEKRDPEPEPDPVAEKPEPLSVAAATTGGVEVTSDPPMEVLVDGQAAGVTPAKLQLPVGAHRVELREPRLHLAWSRSVDVSPASALSLRWKPAHGTIDVRPIPPHVELQISVDGVAVGHTPISAFSVYEGSRRISAVNTATGWKTEKTIEVPPGGRVRVKVNDGAGMEVAN